VRLTFSPSSFAPFLLLHHSKDSRTLLSWKLRRRQLLTLSMQHSFCQRLYWRTRRRWRCVFPHFSYIFCRLADAPTPFLLPTNSRRFRYAHSSLSIDPSTDFPPSIPSVSRQALPASERALEPVSVALVESAPALTALLASERVLVALRLAALAVRVSLGFFSSIRR
jgi:hypothetical protein